MKHKHIRFFSLLLLLTLLLCGCMTPPAEEPAASTQPPQTTAAAPQASAPLPEGSTFAIHFIDVGQADAALVLCDGKSMLIDGGNRGDSDLMYAYLKKLGITYLDYVVCTHAHEDHAGGLAGALSYAEAGKAWSPVPSDDSSFFNDFVKKATAHGKSLIIPAPGTTVSLGSATATVLSPRKEYEDPNNTSLVLRIVYGETSFLFTGDAEREAEADMLAAGVELSATVLKVGHHGGDTSTTYPFLRQVMPQYAVISVGADNRYGHPTDAVLSRLQDADVTLYRTDLHGDIICTSNGKTVSFTTQKSSAAITPPNTGDSAEIYLYIGNLESKKFHFSSCSFLPSEQNSIYFITRDQATSAGYEPCGKCKP